MQKCVFLLCLLFINAGLAVAQDRIITWNNDTIKCRIVSNGKKSIVFERGEGKEKSTEKMDRLEVKGLILSGESGIKTAQESPATKFGFSFDGGPSYLLASTEDAKNAAVAQGWSQQQADHYYKQLKFGWSGSASAHWFLQPGMGVGMHYRFFYSGASEWVTLDPQDNVHLYYGRMNEKMVLNYIGPSLKTVRSAGTGNRFIIASSVSAGLLLYRDEASVLENLVLVTGKAFGASFDVAAEYMITKQVALAVKSGAVFSKLKKVTADDGNSRTTVSLPREQYENVSALDLSAGVRLHF